MARLEAHDTTTPSGADLLGLVGEVGFDSRDKRSKFNLVFGLDVSENESSSSLLVDDCSESGLTLDDAVGDSHLAAEGWEPQNQFNRVNIIGNDDKLGLLGFNQGSDVVDSKLDKNGLLSLIDLFA